MSDDEIRDLLDLGLDDDGSQGSGARGARPGEHLSAEQLWSAGRRQRNRGRAWIGGLGAAAAAASILGIVWAQGFAGGEAGPPPPADGTSDTGPGPTVEVDDGARGEPFFARFTRADLDPGVSEPRASDAPHGESERLSELTGTSTPATLEDLQGTWNGPDGEVFVFEGDRFIATLGGCSVQRRTVALTPESRLQTVGLWEGADDVGECSQEQPLVQWGPALNEEPLLSLDGETLLVTGLDGTTEEPRVHVSLTLGPVDETGFTWADASSEGGLTPIMLGTDFVLLTSGGGDGTTLDDIREINLDTQPGLTGALEQGDDVEAIGYPGTCPVEMEASLRSDGILLTGEPTLFSACAADSDAPLPPVEPSPAVVAVLRSGPTVDFTDGTMVITGTIPESLLDQTAPAVDDAAPTSEGPDEESADPTADSPGSEEPTPPDGIPLVVGTPTVVLMSEGEWAPTGELTALTAEQAEGRRWFQVEHDDPGPTLPGGPGYGLDFDGSSVHVRECSVDVTVPGELRAGVFVATGEPQSVDDPDPGIDCPVPVYTDEWVQILTSEPRMSTDGEILVIAGGGDGTQLEPVGMALVAAGVEDARGGPTAPVTVEDLGAVLFEVPGEVAAQDVGVSDVRDIQPGHTASFSLEDGAVSIGVGCDEQLSGPAWLSHVGPEDTDWQLIAVLPEVSPPGEASASGCTGVAAVEAELWRQLLAHGVFLHHFGDYVILDGWADPALVPGATF